MKFSKILLTVFLTVGFFVYGCSSKNSKDVASADTLDSTQMFSLMSTENQEVKLQDLLKTKKAVLLNFWATWCPPCREEIPDLIKLQDKYKDSGFTILGVNVGESQKKVSNFMQKIGINYPVVLDSEQSVSENYHVVGIPTSLLIDSNGKILGEYHSASEELFADVEKAVK